LFYRGQNIWDLTPSKETSSSTYYSKSPTNIQIFKIRGRLLSTHKEFNAFKVKGTTINMDFRTRGNLVLLLRSRRQGIFLKKIISKK